MDKNTTKNINATINLKSDMKITKPIQWGESDSSQLTIKGEGHTPSQQTIQNSS